MNKPQSLTIDTGEIFLAINNDENKIISFNPEDSNFIERFYSMAEKLKEFERKRSVLMADNAPDEFDIPINIKERFAIDKETNAYIRAQVDSLFGENAAQKIFGNSTSQIAFLQFVDGITSFVSKSREKKIAKYTAPKKSKKASARTKAG